MSDALTLILCFVGAILVTGLLAYLFSRYVEKKYREEEK